MERGADFEIAVTLGNAPPLAAIDPASLERIAFDKSGDKPRRHVADRAAFRFIVISQQTAADGRWGGASTVSHFEAAVVQTDESPLPVSIHRGRVGGEIE
jgi:hypothetical protein